MKCPLDVDVDLVMSERQGVEIDYCPTCRGVWLDRGELDKILDRAAEQSPTPPAPAGHAAGHVPGEGGHGAGGGFEPIPGTPGFGSGYQQGGSARGGSEPAGYGSGGHRAGGYGGYDRDDDDDRRRYGDDRSGYARPGYDPRRKKRKESWLGDLLDFG